MWHGLLKKLIYTKAIIITFSLFTILHYGCGSGGGGENNSNQSGKENISRTPSDSAKPLIGADSTGNVYVIWEEAVSNPDTQIYFAKSNNYGGTFAATRNLTKERGPRCAISGLSSKNASIAVEDESLYLIWENTLPYGRAIKFFRENDGFCRNVSEISNASSSVLGVSTNGNIHVVWTEESGGQNEIFYRYSGDKGETFLPNDPLNISETLLDSSEPLLGIEGSFYIDVVWVEGSEGSREINFIRSTGDGKNFFHQQSISDNGDSSCPVIATAGGLYISFRKDNGIYFTRWLPFIYTFSNPVPVTSSFSMPSCPEMAVGSNEVIYIVWSEGGEIWVAVSSDYGHKFISQNISNSDVASYSPRIVIDGNNVNIVWVEEVNRKGDIFFSRSVDNGKTFLTPAMNISKTPSHSNNPAIATGGEYLYIAWEEGETGSRDIYFVRDSL